MFFFFFFFNEEIFNEKKKNKNPKGVRGRLPQNSGKLVQTKQGFQYEH